MSRQIAVSILIALTYTPLKPLMIAVNVSETDFLLGDFYTNPEEAITEDECMTSDDMNDA